MLGKNVVRIVRIKNIGNQHGSWIKITFEYIYGKKRGTTFIQKMKRQSNVGRQEDAISQVRQEMREFSIKED